MINPRDAARAAFPRAGPSPRPPASTPADTPPKRRALQEDGATAVRESSHEEGLLVLSMTLDPIAVDGQAAAILGISPGDDGARPDLALPPEMRSALKLVAASRSPGRIFVRIGGRSYRCRACVVEPCDSAREPALVVHIRPDSNYHEAVAAVAEQYNLTAREQQVLRGIASGLGSKEIAEMMRISPNTVKSFVRLMTGKMGVSSRSAIIGKLFG